MQVIPNPIDVIQAAIDRLIISHGQIIQAIQMYHIHNAHGLTLITDHFTLIQDIKIALGKGTLLEGITVRILKVGCLRLILLLFCNATLAESATDLSDTSWLRTLSVYVFF